MTPAPGLRVGDADRDAVIAELTEHFAAGRLTAVEREERTGLALQARTRDDLAVLLADLPREPDPQRRPRPPLPLVPRLAVVLVLAVVVWHLLPVLLVAGLVLLVVRRRRGRSWRSGAGRGWSGGGGWSGGCGRLTT